MRASCVCARGGGCCIMTHMSEEGGTQNVIPLPAPLQRQTPDRTPTAPAAHSASANTTVTHATTENPPNNTKHQQTQTPRALRAPQCAALLLESGQAKHATIGPTFGWVNRRARRAQFFSAGLTLSTRVNTIQHKRRSTVPRTCLMRSHIPGLWNLHQVARSSWMTYATHAHTYPGARCPLYTCSAATSS